MLCLTNLKQLNQFRKWSREPRACDQGTPQTGSCIAGKVCVCSLCELSKLPQVVACDCGRVA